MSFSLFIARRLIDNKSTNKRLSRPVIKVATASIALGVAVMIISLSVGLGFKKEIRDKLVGFGTHIQITSYDLNQSYETSPIPNDSNLCNKIRDIDGVKNIQPFVIKPGIIKTTDAIQGIALKGIDSKFDTTFIASVMEEGHCIALPDSGKSNDIILSRKLADLLKLNIGDAVRMYFIQDGIRARKFTLTGIFNSHFPEFDEKMAFVDMSHLTQLNNWDNNQISGYEILLNNFDQMDIVTDEIASITSTYVGPNDTFLRVQNIHELQPQMFGWLALLDMNIVVILALIIAVASLNMVSGLLILILENTNMIGILKSMGGRNSSIQHIFMHMSIYIIGRGMLFGNIIGIVLCIVQQYTKLITLDPESYYLDTVPILLSPITIILLNIGTLILTSLMLIAPSFVISRISPAKSIRFN